MDQLRQVVRLVNDTLGPEVLGIYLYGSAVHGGLKPASDVDFLVITRKSMDDGDRRALAAGLLSISGARVGARPAEVVVVVRSEVRPWRYPPTADFLYGEWLRDEIEATPPQPAPMPGLAIAITQTLAGGRVLDGAAPAEILDPVPPADVVRASLANVPGLLADLPGDTRNVVLTLARVWTTLVTGEIRSKDEAAAWALTRLPPEHQPVLRHARDLYLSSRYSEETWTDGLKARVEPHVAAVLSAIRKLTPEAR